MIYLIDDKRNRQSDYGWDKKLFQKYSDIITPVYLYDEIKNISSQKMLSPENIVLFHESFFDSVDNEHRKNGLEIRKSLNKLSEENKDFMLSFFSGSKNSRKLNQNISYLPVSTLYQNLEVFIKKTKEGKKDFRYLLFGENPNIESELLQKLTEANNLIENGVRASVNKNFLAKSLENEIDDVFIEADTGTFFLDEKNNFLITDEYLHDNVIGWFSDKEYDNIFLPLCFGNTLSDYNGLRFATHIRCTDTPNQLTNIFIYGFVGYDYIFKNEYFDVLKTKNIFLIDYKKEAFLKAENLTIDNFSRNELAREIKKISLKVPQNYEDNHSVANEWGIYKWSRTINAKNDDILNIEKKFEDVLYFKYLKTIYPINISEVLTEDKLKLEYKGNPTILYIDDDANKGWREIFEKIMFEVNDIDFLHLDDEFNEKSKKEIIDISMNTIREENADIVILDFRLHKDDFLQTSIEDVTGYKILKEIKEYNKGIQVIIFSATNKIWNLQALQKAGADGFIIKESPETSLINGFTIQSLENMLDTINLSLERGFLKDFYTRFGELTKELIPRKDFKKSPKPLPKEFVNETLKWLELSCDVLAHDIREVNVTSSFLFMFSVLENLANWVIDKDNPKEVMSSSNHRSQKKFEFEFRKNTQKLKYFKENLDLVRYEKTNINLQSNRSLPWTAKILNTLDFINNGELPDITLSEIITKRNDIVHANATTGNVIELSKDMLITLNEILYKGLKGL